MLKASEPDICQDFFAGLTATQLAEHYNNCIKLSAENKISTKNAFNLQLIDYMASMAKKKDMSNFQVAAGTLDASTKIYAYRFIDKDLLSSSFYYFFHTIFILFFFLDRKFL